MPKKPPPAPPKGTRWPGAGRVKGQPNRISVEVRELVGQLVNDVDYQHRLRQDFRARKVHPTIESLIWTYHLGKPQQNIALTATVDVNARLEEEKRIFAQLEVADLEELAAESQRLVERATNLARIRAGIPQTPPDIVVAAIPDAAEQYTDIEHPESLAVSLGSDNGGYVALLPVLNEEGEGE